MPQTKASLYHTCDAVRTDVSGILRKQDWKPPIEPIPNELVFWSIGLKDTDSGFVPERICAPMNAQAPPVLHRPRMLVADAVFKIVAVSMFGPRLPEKLRKLVGLYIFLKLRLDCISRTSKVS